MKLLNQASIFMNKTAITREDKYCKIARTFIKFLDSVEEVLTDSDISKIRGIAIDKAFTDFTVLEGKLGAIRFKKGSVLSDDLVEIIDTKFEIFDYYDKLENNLIEFYKDY